MWKREVWGEMTLYSWQWMFRVYNLTMAGQYTSTSFLGRFIHAPAQSYHVAGHPDPLSVVAPESIIQLPRRDVMAMAAASPDAAEEYVLGSCRWRCSKAVTLDINTSQYSWTARYKSMRRLASRSALKMAHVIHRRCWKIPVVLCLFKSNHAAGYVLKNTYS